MSMRYRLFGIPATMDEFIEKARRETDTVHIMWDSKIDGATPLVGARSSVSCSYRTQLVAFYPRGSDFLGIGPYVEGLQYIFAESDRLTSVLTKEGFKVVSHLSCRQHEECGLLEMLQEK
jgi:hypothetical protein